MIQKMNNDTKKIIAKEIIYFFSAIIFIIIFWSIIEVRNIYAEKNIENISSKILTFQLEINRNEKRKSFLLEPEKKKILLIGLTELAKNGSTDEEMRSYLNDFENKFSTEKINHIEKLKLLKEKQNNLSTELNTSKNNYLTPNEKKSNILIFTLILFSILYPFRLIFRLLKWSFTTIKTKS
jgi:hypothetical protein